MADSVKLAAAGALTGTSSRSAWAPLREPLFRSLWTAAVISYTGTWMQNVGAGWLMTEMTMSPFMVGLVQAAATLPVFLVILPAGALADMMDRRRLLLITQGWMVLASGTLGLMTLTSCTGPWGLLAFTFLLGLGSVMNDPAWQAITPEIVSPAQHAPAVALNSAGFNVARAVGPALGGLVVAGFGPGPAFLLNAASFSGVILFLYRWKRPHLEHLETRRVMAAIRHGLGYVRDSAGARSLLVRAGAFSVPAAALLALLPIIARPHGATGYGVLLTAFGVGALAGAAVLPWLKHRWSVDTVVGSSVVLFAAMTLAAGTLSGFVALCLVLFLAGAAWIGILACLNVAAQTLAPSYLRARVLSCYLLVLQGGMAIGSALWGALATRLGIPTALLCAACGLMVGWVAARRHSLQAQPPQLTPSVVGD